MGARSFPGMPCLSLGCPLTSTGFLFLPHGLSSQGFSFLLRDTPFLLCLFPWIPIPSPGCALRVSLPQGVPRDRSGFKSGNATSYTHPDARDPVGPSGHSTHTPGDPPCPFAGCYGGSQSPLFTAPGRRADASLGVPDTSRGTWASREGEVNHRQAGVGCSLCVCVCGGHVSWGGWWERPCEHQHFGS